MWAGCRVRAAGRAHRGCSTRARWTGCDASPRSSASWRSAAAALGPSTSSPSRAACGPSRRGTSAAERPRRRSRGETLLRKRRPFTSATSIRRSTPSVNASSDPIRSPRSMPRSSAKWLRVPAGTQTKGSPCGTAAVATTARRSVARGDPEHVHAARHSLVDQRCQVVVSAQNDHLDAALARPLGEVDARRLAATGLGLTNNTGRRGRSAACQLECVIRSDGAGATGEAVRWVARDRAQGRP